MLVGSWGHVGGWIFPLFAPGDHHDDVYGDGDGDDDGGGDRDGDGDDHGHSHGHGETYLRKKRQ